MKRLCSDSGLLTTELWGDPWLPRLGCSGFPPRLPESPSSSPLPGDGGTPPLLPSPAVDKSLLRGSGRKLRMCFYSEIFLSEVSGRSSSLRAWVLPQPYLWEHTRLHAVTQEPIWKASCSHGGMVWSPSLTMAMSTPFTQQCLCAVTLVRDTAWILVAVGFRLTHYPFITCVLTVLWLYFKEVGQYYFLIFGHLRCVFPLSQKERGS